MIVLGVFLMIIGLVLVLAPIPLPEKSPVGWFVAFVGLVVLLIGVLLGVDGVHLR